MKTKFKLALVALCIIWSAPKAWSQADAEPEIPTRLLELAVDHIALTITPSEKAIFHLEVIRNDKLNRQVNLSLVNLNADVSSNLSASTIFGSGIVTLTLTATGVSAERNKYLIEVKAETNSAGVSISRHIKMWLFVLNPPPSKTMITMSVRPELPLVNGIIQPIEGRIVPGKMGTLQMEFFPPGGISQKIPLSVDSLGLFSHNFVFRKHGDWRADAMWIGQGSLPFHNKQLISFEVARRRPIITATTLQLLRRQIVSRDSLKIVGQVAAADPSNMKIKIEVFELPNDAEPVATLFDTTDGTGRFRAAYSPIRREGLHRIVAQFADFSNGVSLLSAPQTGPDGPTGSAIARVGVPTNEYAIIIVGGSTGTEIPLLYRQNRAAAFLYNRLKARGFVRNDVLILSQNDCIEDNLTRNGASCDYTEQIKKFLPAVADRTGKKVFVYLIGGVKKGTGASPVHKFLIYRGSNDPATCTAATIELSFVDLADYLMKDVFNGFDRIVCMAEFDYSGDFLEKLHQKMGNTPPKFIHLSSAHSEREVKTWSMEPEEFFTGKFAKLLTIGQGSSISTSFYNSYQDFSTQLPRLDDNDNDGATFGKPNGIFEDKNVTPTPTSPDGHDSQNEFIGVNLSSALVGANTTDTQTPASPAGPLLSEQARIAVALDNPNNFLIENFRATIYPRPGSNASAVEVPLVFDSTSGAYVSKLVCFPDSGMHRITLDWSYSDGANEKFGVEVIEKTRYPIKESEKRPIVTIPQNDPKTGGAFFDPYLEVSFTYVIKRDPPSVQNVAGPMINVNLFSARNGSFEYLGTGIATNLEFDRVLGVVMPMSMTIGKTEGRSSFWLAFGACYDFKTKDVAFLFGLKYRLLSLKRRSEPIRASRNQ